MPRLRLRPDDTHHLPEARAPRRGRHGRPRPLGRRRQRKLHHLCGGPRSSACRARPPNGHEPAYKERALMHRTARDTTVVAVFIVIVTETAGVDERQHPAAQPRNLGAHPGPRTRLARQTPAQARDPARHQGPWRPSAGSASSSPSRTGASRFTPPGCASATGSTAGCASTSSPTADSAPRRTTAASSPGTSTPPSAT